MTGFLGGLIFAFCFFGVYSLREIPFAANPPARTYNGVVALVFIIAAWLLSRI
jgi:hypothetical protein